MLMRTNHALHWKPERQVLELFCYRNRFKMLKQCWARVPGRALTARYNVVSIKRADWNAEQLRNFELLCKFAQISLVLCENLFRKIDEVHLIDSGDDVTYPQ